MTVDRAATTRPLGPIPLLPLAVQAGDAVMDSVSVRASATPSVHPRLAGAWRPLLPVMSKPAWDPHAPCVGASAIIPHTTGRRLSRAIRCTVFSAFAQPAALLYCAMRFAEAYPLALNDVVRASAGRPSLMNPPSRLDIVEPVEENTALRFRCGPSTKAMVWLFSCPGQDLAG
jgi:hypothetical protein